MLRHNVTRGLSCPCSLRNWESLATIYHLEYFWIMSLGRAASTDLFSSLQFSSVAQSCLTLCNPLDCSTSGLLVHHQIPELLKLISTESVMASNHFILCHPLLLLPSIFPSISIFSNELVLHIRWPKYWSFSIISSNEYSGLISFRMDWLELLAVQRTLKSLLQLYIQKHQFFST